MQPEATNLRIGDQILSLRWSEVEELTLEPGCCSVASLSAYAPTSQIPVGDLQVVSYHPRRDRYPFETWDNEIIEHVSMDALAVFNPSAALGEGRALHGLRDLGYRRQPRTVLILTNMTFRDGYAASTLAAAMLRRAIVQCAQDPGVLVLAQFPGAEFRDTGYPTNRGWALQLGFEVTSTAVLVLANSVRAQLADPATPYPKFTRRTPKPSKAQIAAGPTFAGRIFARERLSNRDEPPSFSVEALRLVSKAPIADEEALRAYLLEGLRAGDLEMREADRRGDPAHQAGHTVPAQLALGNTAFEVPLLVTQDQLRTPLYKLRYRLSEEHRAWLAFLLQAGDVGSALTALWRIAGARYDADYMIASTRDVDGWFELHDPAGGRSLLIVGTGDGKDAVYCRVGTARDGFRPIAVLANAEDARGTNYWGRETGGARYLDLREGPTVERWTQKKTNLHKQQLRAIAKAKKHRAERRRASYQKRKATATPS